jgi:hypothetical protein
VIGVVNDYKLGTKQKYSETKKVIIIVDFNKHNKCGMLMRHTSKHNSDSENMSF